ncbi:MAG: hypothetical protein P0116_11485 [Candidatus Nitrosocosmicus sp.]|nr:hypothetical protein [Candidatus Nitrosocosmicus sp.]
MAQLLLTDGPYVLEHKPEQTDERPLMSGIQSRNYGLRLGLMAATATTMGFGLGFEHIGWLVGAALFAMDHAKISKSCTV